MGENARKRTNGAYQVIELEWHGLYGDGWKNEIVPDAFTHPAKYSRALIRHIYEYLMQEDMIHGGDTCLDPFGGVALGGLDAMRLGLHWVGVELEPKFVALGTANIALWNSRYAGKMLRWGTARLLQGDSRNLRSVIEAARCAVSSPPYSVDALGHKGGEGPKAAGKTRPDYERAKERVGFESYYGLTEGNLGNLPEGDYRAAISSPPYADGCAHNGGDDPHPEHIQGGEYHGVGINAAISSPPYEEARIGQESGQEHCGRGDQYGGTAGQIGAMRGDGYDAAVSSPPYEGALAQDNRRTPSKVMLGIGRNTREQRPCEADGKLSLHGEMYGQSDDNLGNSKGDDFWHAARQVVSETYAVLAPGAPAVWVVKAFVRNKEIVPFCDQWQALCEAVGFETVAIARAWLVEDYGMQTAMDGNHKKYRKERKSFFRRLAESKGSPRIDWEMVLIMRKVTPEAKTLTDT